MVALHRAALAILLWAVTFPRMIRGGAERSRDARAGPAHHAAAETPLCSQAIDFGRALCSMAPRVTPGLTASIREDGPRAPVPGLPRF